MQRLHQTGVMRTRLTPADEAGTIDRLQESILACRSWIDGTLRGIAAAA